MRSPRARLHELRGALAPIGMWVHLALDPATSEAQRLAYLRTVAGLVRRMGALVEREARAPATGPAAPDDPADRPQNLQAG